MQTWEEKNRSAEEKISSAGQVPLERSRAEINFLEILGHTHRGHCRRSSGTLVESNAQPGWRFLRPPDVTLVAPVKVDLKATLGPLDPESTVR